MLVFQPRFEYGPKPTAGATLASASFELRIRDSGGPTFTAGTPPILACRSADVGSWIMRYALLDQPATPVVQNRATTAADLATLPARLSAILGLNTVGTVVPYSAAP